MEPAPAPERSPLPERVLLFDGVCAVCDATVQWVLDRDPEGHFAFAPLQGETAAAIFARHPELPENLDSLVLVERLPTGEERVSWYSTAILRVAAELPPPWRWLRAALIVPAVLRDPFYRGFARVRYRVFGKLESCRMPDPGTEDRFLP